MNVARGMESTDTRKDPEKKAPQKMQGLPFTTSANVMLVIERALRLSGRRGKRIGKQRLPTALCRLACCERLIYRNRYARFILLVGQHIEHMILHYILHACCLYLIGDSLYKQNRSRYAAPSLAYCDCSTCSSAYGVDLRQPALTHPWSPAR